MGHIMPNICSGVKKREERKKIRFSGRKKKTNGKSHPSCRHVSVTEERGKDVNKKWQDLDDSNHRHLVASSPT